MKENYIVIIDNYDYLFSDIGVCLDFINDKLQENWTNITFIDRQLQNERLINDIIDYTQLCEEY